MIGIVSSAGGNVKSILYALRRLRIDAKLIYQPEDILSVEKIILPGVGSYDYAMYNLKKSGFYSKLRDAVEGRGKPILGICLGMQLMVSKSDEGEQSGFGWINGSCRRLNYQSSGDIRVPHIGWSKIKISNFNDDLAGKLNSESRYYFLHSYAVDCEREVDVIAKCEYGTNFDCIIRRGNIVGVQFHPERSGPFGEKIFIAFSQIGKNSHSIYKNII